MCRKRRIRGRMRESPWVTLACSVQRILRDHTVFCIRCIGSDDDVFYPQLRSAWRRQALRPAAAILPPPASGCFGTPWQSQHQGGAAVPIGELLQETAAGLLPQEPLEWRSSVWCFESLWCSIEPPLCRFAPFRSRNAAPNHHPKWSLSKALTPVMIMIYHYHEISTITSGLSLSKRY
jgi:hypothetical protein